MTSLAMRRLLNQTCETKRATLSSGKRSTPVAYLSGISCMPLDPVSSAEAAQYQKRRGTDAPVFLFQTVVEDGYDIRAGDVLTYNDTDYPVVGVENWSTSTFGEGGFLRLVVEEVKP